MNEKIKEIIKQKVWTILGLLIGFGIYDYITTKEFSVFNLLTRLVVLVVLDSIFIIVEYKSNKSR